MVDRPPPLHLLVVEDNEDDVFLIGEALGEAALSCTFHVVRDAVDALRYVRREGEYQQALPAELVLLDINMPRRDGFELLQDLKRDPALSHLPVIVFTTSDAASDVLRSFRYGACSYVTKPPGFQVFRQVIEQILRYWTLVSRVPGRPQPE